MLIYKTKHSSNMPVQANRSISLPIKTWVKLEELSDKWQMKTSRTIQACIDQAWLEQGYADKHTEKLTLQELRDGQQTA